MTDQSTMVEQGVGGSWKGVEWVGSWEGASQSGGKLVTRVDHVNYALLFKSNYALSFKSCVVQLVFGFNRPRDFNFNINSGAILGGHKCRLFEVYA